MHISLYCDAVVETSPVIMPLMGLNLADTASSPSLAAEQRRKECQDCGLLLLRGFDQRGPRARNQESFYSVGGTKSLIIPS